MWLKSGAGKGFSEAAFCFSVFQIFYKWTEKVTTGEHCLNAENPNDK